MMLDDQVTHQARGIGRIIAHVGEGIEQRHARGLELFEMHEANWIFSRAAIFPADGKARSLATLLSTSTMPVD